jgi:hypothetical protein
MLLSPQLDSDGKTAGEKNRQSLRDMGTDNLAAIIAIKAPQYKALMSKGNLDAILNALDKIGTNAAAVDKASNSTLGTTAATSVVNAFIAFTADSNPKPLKDLPPEVISNFFKAPANSDAMTSLIQGLNLPGPQGVLLKELQKDWGTLTVDNTRKDTTERDGYGIIEILSDAAAVKEMQSRLSDDGKGEKYSSWGLTNGINWLRIWHDISWEDSLPKHFDENLEYLMNLNNTMVDVKNGTTVAPTNTAANVDIRNPLSGHLTMN